MLKIIRRLLTIVFIALVGFVLIACAAVMVKQTDFIYPRSYTTDVRDEIPPKDVTEVWWAETDGDRTEAWYYAPQVTSGPAPAVIYFHGNAGVIDEYSWVVDLYRPLGMGVLLVEYRGYGRSTGTPSETAIATDSRRFYDMLVQRPEIDGERVMFHGESLGGGVALKVARTHAPCAVVLQSTFTSIADMAPPFIPGALIRDKYANDEAIQRLDVPILILHGRNDSIVPFSHGEELAALAPDATLIAFDADHNDIGYVDPAGFERSIVEFVQENVLRSE